MLENLQNLAKSSDFSSENAEILRFIRETFPENELTQAEWKILQDFVNHERFPHSILTLQICEKIEEDKENESFLRVRRFVEINPFSMKLHLKKTVTPIGNFEKIENHQKIHRFITKF